MIICVFRTGSGFSRTLQSDEHDDAGLALLGGEGRLPGIEHVAELGEDGLLYDASLVGAGGEGLEVDDLPDVGLHVADHLELDVGLQERAGDLVEALPEHLLVDHRGVAHLRERAGDAPAQLREHHLGWAPGGSDLVGGGVGFRRRSGAARGAIWGDGCGGRGREEKRTGRGR